jgi:long-chain-fatty-acid--CoA ligase ACSBG
MSIGFAKFDTVNIIGFNSPEWLFSNVGAIAAGGIAAGIYATNIPEACEYISEHSEAKVVVVEGVKQLEKYYSIAKSLPNLKVIVVYGPDSIPADVASKVSVPVYKFDEFVKLGVGVSNADLKARGDEQKPNEVNSLIYTSGTTGPPKAVMITHDNITWTAQSQLSTLARPLSNDDHVVSYLPLSHIAAQMLDMHFPMATGAQVWFAQPDALRGSLGITLRDVRPTVFFGVPRVWEKIYDKMQEAAKSSTGVQRMISAWAKNKATTYWVNNQYGGNKKNPFMFGVASMLLGKVKLALGLDRVGLFQWRS